MEIKLSYGRSGLFKDIPEELDVIRSFFSPGLADEKCAIIEMG